MKNTTIFEPGDIVRVKFGYDIHGEHTVLAVQDVPDNEHGVGHPQWCDLGGDYRQISGKILQLARRPRKS